MRTLFSVICPFCRELHFTDKESSARDKVVSCCEKMQPEQTRPYHEIRPALPEIKPWSVDEKYMVDGLIVAK